MSKIVFLLDSTHPRNKIATVISHWNDTPGSTKFTGVKTLRSLKVVLAPITVSAFCQLLKCPLLLAFCWSRRLEGSVSIKCVHFFNNQIKHVYFCVFQFFLVHSAWRQLFGRFRKTSTWLSRNSFCIEGRRKKQRRRLFIYILIKKNGQTRSQTDARKPYSLSTNTAAPGNTPSRGLCASVVVAVVVAVVVGVVFVCLIWFFTSHQQSFSYIGTCLPGLNQY